MGFIVVNSQGFNLVTQVQFSAGVPVKEYSMIASLFSKLLIGHAIGDFVLQTQFIAETKNWTMVPDYLDKDHLPMWPYTLTAHALTNGGIVWFITGSYIIGLIEFISHWAIDFIKCSKLIDLHTDQFAHIFFKFFYCVLALHQAFN